MLALLFRSHSNRKPNQSKSCRPRIEWMEPRTLLSAVTWTGGGGDNNWDTAANWSTDSVPTSGDDVTINIAANVVHSDNDDDSINSLTSTEPLTISGGTLSIAAASTIDSTLSITGGTLTGTGNLSVSGLVTLTAGTLSGASELNANGGMLINPTGGNFNLDGRTVNNAAGQTATWTGSVDDFIEASDGSVFNNLGTFLVDGLALYEGSGIGAASSFNDVGTFITTANTANAGFNVSFNVARGSVDVKDNSQLDLDAGGTVSGAVFDTESSGDLDLGNYVFDTATTISGSGNLELSGMVLPGNYTFTGPIYLEHGTAQIDSSLAQSSVGLGDAGDTTLSGTGTVGAISGQGNVSPGDGSEPGILNAQGDVDLEAEDDEGGQASFTVLLNGPTAGTGYSQLNASGQVTLDGCSLDASLGFTPANAEQFTIIKSTAPIQGTFDGLPEGASLTIGNTPFTISYHGGNGDDVVLTHGLGSEPVVTGISPKSGSAAGSTLVTITGTGFYGATAVDFGTTAATDLTVVNDTTITADSPAGSGAVDVTVVTPGGTSATSSADRFTYTAAVAAPAVTGINPNSGPAAGGTLVTITGTGFTGATAVDFGTTAVTGLTVVNETKITAESSAGTGVVNVTVISPAGTSAVSPADQFTYVGAPPMVMSVSRFGFHMRPTTLVIQFNGALDAASAQNLKDYTIIGPGGRHIAVASAVCDANAWSVTLAPATRLNVHDTYQLIVRGTGSNPIRDRAGVAIDGAGDGTVGSDYETKITAANLVILGNHPRARKSLAGILAKEERALLHRLIPKK